MAGLPRDHVPPSACPGVRALGGNGSNNVGSVGVSIPTRYPDFGSPVSPSVLSAVIYGAHPKPVIAACARQKLGGAA